MVNSINEQDLYLLISYDMHSQMMPLDVLGYTHTILIELASVSLARCR